MQANPTDCKGKFSMGMFLVALGIVYGDIGTSPMYVMKSIIEGNGGIAYVDEEFIVGSLSLVIWTITLLTTIKHVLIALRADNHGEGGIFALYSLVRHCGKWLIVPTMIGGCTMLADGVLTPAVTVTTAVEGLRSIEVVDDLLGSGQLVVVLITLVIISTLFMIQKSGTSSIGKMFGPVMVVWFLFLGITGLCFTMTDFSILRALNPVYALQVLFSPDNKEGLMILGSVFLCTTGAEALYTDMGHVGRTNIYVSWPFVKICLILNYMGQCVWIIQNQGDPVIQAIPSINPFYVMLPEAMRPAAILLSAMAAIIASQALISGSYTLVHEAASLDLMPHLNVRYPSDTKGQIYIPSVNNILWFFCVAVILYFQSGSRMENAYGLAITISMLMMTILFSVYIGSIHKQWIAAVLFAVTAVIGAYFASASYPALLHGAAKLLPERHLAALRRLRLEVRRTLGRWLRAQALMLLLVFAALTAAFLLLRVEYALLLALFTALVDALPVLGTGTVLLPWALGALLTGAQGRALGLALTWAAVTVLRSSVQPKLLGDQLGLPPLAALAALYVGWKVWGVWGMLTFPLLAVIGKQVADSGVLCRKQVC